MERSPASIRRTPGSHRRINIRLLRILRVKQGRAAFSRPGGTFENSPAIYRWVCKASEIGSPGGTIEIGFSMTAGDRSGRKMPADRLNNSARSSFGACEIRSINLGLCRIFAGTWSARYNNQAYIA